MIIKYTQDQFNSAKSKDLLDLECHSCSSIFKCSKNAIKHELIHNRSRCKYCSDLCMRKARHNRTEVECNQCHTLFIKQVTQIKEKRMNFCSHSCRATYANTHKSHGTRRSKLEIWLEEQLTILYPNLIIDYNKKNAIGSELDIYIPSLQLAFELNGIFHYKPIYGTNKLNQIQNNDTSKSKACFDNQIDLCIIDVSTLIKFKPKKAQIFLDIIVNILNQRTKDK